MKEISDCPLKTKSQMIVATILALLAIVLIYQSFIVLPQRADNIESIATSLSCPSSPLYELDMAIQEELDKLPRNNEETTLIRPLCLFKDEIIHLSLLSNDSVQPYFDPTSNDDIVEVTSSEFIAKTDLLVTGGVSCITNGASHDCKISLYVTPFSSL